MLTDRYHDKFLAMVRAGKSKHFRIDPNNPAMAYDSMNIYAKSGTKVRFTGLNGHEFQQRRAKEFLTVDGVYTVDYVDVASFSSEVHLQEIDNEGFNTVMFAEVAELMPLERIVASLREQASLRAPENDEGGVIQKTAEFLEKELVELWETE